mgnify:CR=1 FL=1|jgi:hypothetical protein
MHLALELHTWNEGWRLPFIEGDGVGVTPSPRHRSAWHLLSTLGSNRPHNRHLINGRGKSTCGTCGEGRWEATDPGTAFDVGSGDPTSGPLGPPAVSTGVPYVGGLGGTPGSHQRGVGRPPPCGPRVSPVVPSISSWWFWCWLCQIMSWICCSCINKLRVQVELVMDKICSCHVVSPCNRGMLTVFCMWISMVYPPSTRSPKLNLCSSRANNQT